MAEASFAGALAGVRLSKPPELSYTSKGTALLKFTCLGDRYSGNQGGERQTKTVMFRVAMWGPRAEFMHKLMMQHQNPKGPGVGLEVTVMISSVPDVWSWVQMTDGKPDLDEKGRIKTSANIELDAFDVKIAAGQLPDGAYQAAAGGGRAGNGGGRRTKLDEQEDIGDIPF